ncbi:MAG TPA: hypothetical protein VLG11_04630 [Candidatus Saccharimonadales bacterium]|nr:hypothetical protein [Candidatus Saccharimonadales bacterium]
MSIIIEKPNPLGLYERTYPEMHPGFMLAATSPEERETLVHRLGTILRVSAGISGLEDSIAHGLYDCIRNHEITKPFVGHFTKLLFARDDLRSGVPDSNANPWDLTFATSAGLIGRLQRSGCVEPNIQPTNYQKKGGMPAKVWPTYDMSDFATQLELVWEPDMLTARDVRLASGRRHVLLGILRDNDFTPYATQLSASHPAREDW